MALPGYAAEASLYRTSGCYRGASSSPVGDAGLTVVAQQIDCDALCAIKWQACNIGCAISGGIFAPFCLAACGVTFGLCLNDCPNGGGGGGGVPQCCPQGRTCRCGGRCVTNPNGTISCVGGECLTPNQQCP
jgi:hypothetical protein